MIRVEIITIGDELLIGQVIDTNSSWMAVELNKMGWDVQYKTTVGDDEQDILNAFEMAFSRASIVLVTGGIGPTKDDITKKTLCHFFHTRLVFDEDTLSNVKEIVNRLGKKVNELTRDQAYIPENATIIQNKVGTAPVTWFERGEKVLVSMPGVPFEMKWIMTNEVLPRLQKKYAVSDSIQHLTFWVKDYSESQLAIYISDFENNLPEFIRLAYLPNYGLIRLRLTGKSSEEAFLKKEMELQRNKLLLLLKGHIISEEDSSPEFLLHKLLLEKKLSLSLAESCTGGKIASLFTAIPGASAYFKGGVVSYSNEAKNEILSVNIQDIEREGAVSETVVLQMLNGAKRIFHTDCAIATSGIAGPEGGTPDKPVGTVWIAAAFQDKVIAKRFLFSNNRESNILRSSNSAILMLLDLLQQ